MIAESVKYFRLKASRAKSEIYGVGWVGRREKQVQAMRFEWKKREKSSTLKQLKPPSPYLIGFLGKNRCLVRSKRMNVVVYVLFIHKFSVEVSKTEKFTELWGFSSHWRFLFWNTAISVKFTNFSWKITKKKIRGAYIFNVTCVLKLWYLFYHGLMDFGSWSLIKFETLEGLIEINSVKIGMTDVTYEQTHCWAFNKIKANPLFNNLTENSFSLSLSLSLMFIPVQIL